MNRMVVRIGVATAAALSGVAMGALPAGATSTIGTATAAKASSAHVKAGASFSISGTVKHGSAGLAGQQVVLEERATAKSKWTKLSSQVTGSKGAYSFAGLKGLKHSEQYVVVHPAQKVAGKAYGASRSKVITITK